MGELVRLRNEVGQLRQQVAKKNTLEAANAQLLEAEEKKQEAVAYARSLPNYWPKDQLAFAGYAEPASAIRSFLTALKNGDLNAMMDCFAPDVATEMKAAMQGDLGDPAGREARFKQQSDGYFTGADGFHIVDQTATGPGEVTVHVSFDGLGRGQKMVLRNIANQRKFVAFPN